jgi:hypothetical protein
MARNAPHFSFMFIVRRRFNFRNLIHCKVILKSQINVCVKRSFRLTTADGETRYPALL